MRAVVKVRGIMAMADVSQKEMAILAGVSPSRVSHYLSFTTEMEDFDGGLKLLQVSRALMHLVQQEKLPLPVETPASMRVVDLMTLLKDVSLDNVLTAASKFRHTTDSMAQKENKTGLNDQ